MKKNLFFALLLLCSTVLFAQSKEDRVWSRVQDLTKAVFETKDSVALRDMVSNRVSYGHSSGLMENKQEMIKNAVTSATTYKNLEFEKVSIDVQNDVALVRHNLRGTSVDSKGAESPLNIGIVQVWKKESGKWRIWARQAFRINPKS